MRIAYNPKDNQVELICSNVKEFLLFFNCDKYPDCLVLNIDPTSDFSQMFNPNNLFFSRYLAMKLNY